MRTVLLVIGLLAASTTTSIAGFEWIPLNEQVAESAAIAEVEITIGKHGARRVRLIRWLLRPQKGVVIPKQLPVCWGTFKRLSQIKLWLFQNYCQDVGNRMCAGKQTRRSWHNLPATKLSLRVVEQARRRGKYQAVLTYPKNCLRPGALPPTAYAVRSCKKGEKLALRYARCLHAQSASMQHWAAHPDHAKWRARLMKLLKKRH